MALRRCFEEQVGSACVELAPADRVTSWENEAAELGQWPASLPELQHAPAAYRALAGTAFAAQVADLVSVSAVEQAGGVIFAD